MLILIVFGSLVGFICNLGVGEKQEPEPYTGYRKYIIYYLTFHVAE